MLLNFEQTLVSEFGEKHAIRGGLTFTLRFSKAAYRPQTGGAARSQGKTYRAVKQFIDAFRSSLSADVQNDLAYSFKVYLLPKMGGHASKDAVAIEWVKYDPSNPDEMKQYEKVVAMIKEKQVPVANLGLLKPGEVVRQVQKRLGKRFNMYHHVQSYRHFNARPGKGAVDPTACDARYCVYDQMHKDYGYRPEWVEFLIQQLSDPATYELVTHRKPSLRAVPEALGGASAA